METIDGLCAFGESHVVKTALTDKSRERRGKEERGSLVCEENWPLEERGRRKEGMDE